MCISWKHHTLVLTMRGEGIEGVFFFSPEHKILPFYKSVWPKTGLNTVSLNWQRDVGIFQSKEHFCTGSEKPGNIIYVWSSNSQRRLTYLQTLQTRQKHTTKSLFSFAETLICGTQIFLILRSRNGTKLLYGKTLCAKNTSPRGNIFFFFSGDIWTEGVLLLCMFEQMLNGCLFKLEACGPTSCLSSQITDFSWKSEAITGQRFIPVRGAHVTKKGRQATPQHTGPETSLGSCPTFKMCAPWVGRLLRVLRATQAADKTWISVL